jgi:uncharacterized protein
MPFIRNCTVALLHVALLAVAAPAAAQSEGTAEFLVFLGGQQIGREQVTVGRTGSDRIVASSGRHSAPINITINRFEARYSSDWQPIELSIDAAMGERALGLKTSFGLTTAINEISQGGKTNSKTDQVSARTVILPNGFFGAYEALAARLGSMKVGSEIPLYIAPQIEVRAQVRAITDEEVKFPDASVTAKKYELVIQNPSAQLATNVLVDTHGRLMRVDMPANGLSIVRSDLASVAVRQEGARNATDADVRIPANGFTLAATITMPTQAAGRLRHPAVILVPGSGPVDRDETVAGIAIFRQLAGALADRGFLVVRYDKRGAGQSGGRTENATLEDFADDVRAVFDWLKKRSDVDKKSVAVVGHSEGGSVALLAGAKEDEIASLVLVATPGTRGAELILEQQAHQLDLMKVSAEERAAKVDLQNRIQLAVLSGVGWERVPPEMRKQADTPWFRSLLSFDPAKVMPRVKQPILVVQGALDKQVTPHHADTLVQLARQRKKNPPVEFVALPGVNHLLAKAETGEVDEYGALKARTIVPDVAEKIAAFLRK